MMFTRIRARQTHHQATNLLEHSEYQPDNSVFAIPRLVYSCTWSIQVDNAQDQSGTIFRQQACGTRFAVILSASMHQQDHVSKVHSRRQDSRRNRSIISFAAQVSLDS
jgi:hypothetical protein